MEQVNISTLSVTAYLAELARVLQDVTVTTDRQRAVQADVAARQAVEKILGARSRRGKVLVIGNGGSAAIASHLHNDLTKAVGVRALVFNEQPLLTALANDEGYANVFARPIELWTDAGDVLIAISSSGNSPNIVNGTAAALRHGASVVTFSGFTPDNSLRALGHLNFYVPCDHYGLVEQAHSVLTHHLSDAAAAAVGAVTPCNTRDDVQLLAA